MSNSSGPSDSRAVSYAVVPEREDGELLDIGQQCSARDQNCTVVDYLPFVCDHCKKRFCSDHRMPESHSCEKWDVSMVDRRALECPLCSELIAIPPGEDPNIKLGRHVDEDCAVMTGKVAKKSTTPTCSRARCGKPLWQPITCEKCRKQFCASHRYPKEHQCASLSLSMSSPVSAPASRDQSNLNSLASLSSQTSAKSAAAMAALKRQFVSTNLGSTSSPSQRAQTQLAPPVSASMNKSTSSSTSDGSSSSTATKPKISVPFNAKDRPELHASTRFAPDVNATSGMVAVGDIPGAPAPQLMQTSTLPTNPTGRRAMAERKSQLRAMEERQRKGLLNPQEEDRLKALRESVKDDKDCIIM